MARPVFFDGNEFREVGPSNRIEADALPTTAVLSGGSVAFTAPQTGVNPTADSHLATQGSARRDLSEFGFWQGAVAAAQNAPPGSPVTGNRYIVGTTPTGAWAGRANQIATYRTSLWTYVVPVNGTTVFDRNDAAYKIFDGTNWVLLAAKVAHAALSGLQGGTTSEYYHLTAAQHTALTSSQAQGLFFGTPAGAAGVPGMRALVLSDLPSTGADDIDVLMRRSGATVWDALAPGDIGAVPTSRTVSAGTGLSGGGNLGANRTLSWNGVTVTRNGGTAVATRRGVDFSGGVDGVTDDSSNDRVVVDLPDPMFYALMFGR